MEPEDNSLAISFNDAGTLGHNPCLESHDGSQHKRKLWFLTQNKNLVPKDRKEV